MGFDENKSGSAINIEIDPYMCKKIMSPMKLVFEQ